MKDSKIINRSYLFRTGMLVRQAGITEVGKLVAALSGTKLHWKTNVPINNNYTIEVFLLEPLLKPFSLANKCSTMNNVQIYLKDHYGSFCQF